MGQSRYGRRRLVRLNVAPERSRYIAEIFIMSLRDRISRRDRGLHGVRLGIWRQLPGPDNTLGMPTLRIWTPDDPDVDGEPRPSPSST